MKHEIKKGDPVVVLYHQFVMYGTCVKINNKTIKVSVPAQRMLVPFVKNFPKDRVAHEDDMLAVVWTVNRGVEGSYRLEYQKYPALLKRAGDWGEPPSYVVEEL